MVQMLQVFGVKCAHEQKINLQLHVYNQTINNRWKSGRRPSKKWRNYLTPTWCWSYGRFPPVSGQTIHWRSWRRPLDFHFGSACQRGPHSQLVLRLEVLVGVLPGFGLGNGIQKFLRFIFVRTQSGVAVFRSISITNLCKLSALEIGFPELAQCCSVRLGVNSTHRDTPAQLTPLYSLICPQICCKLNKKKS